MTFMISQKYHFVKFIIEIIIEIISSVVGNYYNTFFYFVKSICIKVQPTLKGHNLYSLTLEFLAKNK